MQRSLILRRLNDLLPPSAPVLNALDRVDPAPSIAGPTAPVAPPDPAIASDPDVLRVSRSVVRVLGTACGLGVEGSGWVAAPGLVVTNAHLVAGEDDTTVTTVDGASLDAVPVRYDPANDLALLWIDTPIPALGMDAKPRRGTAGAVLGYPENGPYAVATCPPRRHHHGDQRGLLRQRADPALDRLTPRRRPQRQLRRAAGRLPRPGHGHRLRRHHLRPAGRLRNSERSSSLRANRGDGTRRYGSMHGLTGVTCFRCAFCTYGGHKAHRYSFYRGGRVLLPAARTFPVQALADDRNVSSGNLERE